MTAPVIPFAAAGAGPLTGEQREVLALALADAIAHRCEHTDGECADCDTSPSLLCGEGAAELDRADDYRRLAAELGIEVDR
jgi:hypothetical protein